MFGQLARCPRWVRSSPSTAFRTGSALPSHSCRGCCAAVEGKSVPATDIAARRHMPLMLMPFGAARRQLSEQVGFPWLEGVACYIAPDGKDCSAIAAADGSLI